MKELIKKINFKYKNFIIYFIVGSIATLINALSYYFYRMVINTYEINVILSWITSLIFAFYMNRKYVFQSQNKIIKEFISFSISRLLTLFLELIFMYIFVDLFKMNDMSAKLINLVIVFISNYLLSKFLVFKKNTKT